VVDHPSGCFATPAFFVDLRRQASNQRWEWSVEKSVFSFVDDIPTRCLMGVIKARLTEYETEAEALRAITVEAKRMLKETWPNVQKWRDRSLGLPARG
jgi:hypothetical protein